MKMKWLRVTSAAVIALSLMIALTGCGGEKQEADYGVFLSAAGDIRELEDYRIVVIDAQYFSKEDISAFRAAGHIVYTYINVGSLENFRSYYDEYEGLTLGAYENWDEERWVDVSDPRWQEFMTEELIPFLEEKDTDGYFVDNCDVYYNYPSRQIMDGLTVIMKALVDTGRQVVINGGDTYLDAYCRSGGSWDDVITGINQECVFSAILWDDDRFGTADPEDRAYFQDYIERYAAEGADIYLLEYTRDRSLIRKIRSYCQEKGYNYYISDSIELD